MRSFSFSNFDAKRRRELAGDIKIMVIVKMSIAGVLFLVNPFLGIWVGTAGLMLGGIVGGMRLPDVISRPNFRQAKDTGLRFKVFRRAHVHNHARAQRSASRPSFAHASGGDDSDGGSESDSGDPPGPNFSFPVTPSQNFYRKPNSFISPWRLRHTLGCWRLLCRQCPSKEVSA